MLNSDLWLEIMTCFEDPRDIVRLRMVRFKTLWYKIRSSNSRVVLFVGLSVSLYHHVWTFCLAARS